MLLKGVCLASSKHVRVDPLMPGLGVDFRRGWVWASETVLRPEFGAYTRNG